MKKEINKNILKVFPLKDFVFIAAIFSLRGLIKTTYDVASRPMSRHEIVVVSPEFQFFYFVSGAVGMVLMILASLKYYQALKQAQEDVSE